MDWRSLNLKLVTLLALTQYKRAADLSLLDIKFCAISKDSVTFGLGEKPKHHRKKGKLTEPIVFKASLDDLCPVKSIVHYLEITSQARQNSEESKLFLSHLRPHKSVTQDTIRRWLKTVLNRAGINTKVFQGHSIRAAASLKARARGASISDILNCGGWSQESTWQKFYNKEIV